MTSGGTPPSGVAHFYGGGIPWVSISDITRSGKYVTKTEKTLSVAGLVNSAAKLYADGIVLYAMYASLGECAIAVGQVSSSQAILGINPGPRLHRDYLYYYLSSIKSSVRELGQHGTQANLNAGMVRRFSLRLPPLGQQRAIAEVLTDVDQLISTLERLIKKKQAIKEGMMQELLTGRTRLPGFSKRWREVLLGDVAVMTSGGTPPSGVAQFYGGGIPWVSISDITRSGKYVTKTEKTLSAAGLINSAAQLYADGIVLYAMYASLGECAIAVGQVSSSQAILGINPGPRLHRDYLYYYLSFIKSSVRELGQHGTQANLNAGMVRRFTLRLPPLGEQRAIAVALEDCDQETQLLRDRLAKTCAIKQGMMQQLLTGRTRLPIAEVVA